jgi:ankyrin repeat protein
MHLSARNGHLGLVKLLLERDADVHVFNDEGRTPYQLSMGMEYRKITDLLRDYETRGARHRVRRYNPIIWL